MTSGLLHTWPTAVRALAADPADISRPGRTKTNPQSEQKVSKVFVTLAYILEYTSCHGDRSSSVGGKLLFSVDGYKQGRICFLQVVSIISTNKL